MKFTKEELRYIEKVMDINASILNTSFRKHCENFVMLQMQQKDKEYIEMLKFCVSQIEELYRASHVTNSIRKKIEEIWKNE